MFCCIACRAMKKQEFVQSICDKAQLSESQVRSVLEAGHAITCEVLARGESVNIMGLGQMLLRPRAEGKARDVRRGTSVIVPARAVIQFKPTRSVVDLLRGTDLALLAKGRKA